MDKAVGNLDLGEDNATGQMAFALHPPRSVSEQHFVAAGSNALARRWLNQTGWPDRRLLLYGDDSCGKTHMLHIWAERRQARILDAHQLEVADLVSLTPSLPGAMAIDNIDRITSERALLHVLNLAREQKCSLLLASRLPPARLPIILPDLASRLRAITLVPVASPEDSLRFTLLLRLIAERQLVVSKPMLDWLLRNLPRTGDAIVAAVHRLDQAGLAHGRPLTRALARNALAGLVGEDQQQG